MRKQKGAALIVVLSMLTMSLMLGLSGMQSSLIDERLAGNYKASSEASMNAEHAASGLFVKVKDKDTTYEIISILEFDDINGTDWEGFLEFSSSHEEGCEQIGEGVACFFRIPAGFPGFDPGDYLVAIGSVSEGGVLISESHLLSLKLSPIMIPRHLREGMVAGEDVDITGNSVFNGNVHANGYVNASYEVVMDGASVTQSEYNLDDEDFVDIEPIDFSKYIIDVELDHEEGKGKNKGDLVCDFEGDGDMGGVVYYCPGTIDVSGDFKNVTLLAGGDIWQNGGPELGEDGLNVVMIAKGDIDFRGSSDVFGIFWSGGDILQSGNSDFYGSFVADGNIEINGGVFYNQVFDIDAPSIEEFSGYMIDEWR